MIFQIVWSLVTFYKIKNWTDGRFKMIEKEGIMFIVRCYWCVAIENEHRCEHDESTIFGIRKWKKSEDRRREEVCNG